MTIRKPSKPARKPARRRKSEDIQRDPTLWEDLLAIARSIPEEERKRLPTDGGRNADHYLYGTPKKDP
jgi:hypothetical protein